MDRILSVCILGLVSILILHGITVGEFSINGMDETVHAVTGLYFSDVLRDLPIFNPIQYTYNYYAQFPALGLILWPPLFHFTEGVVFLLLGPSVVTARITIWIFAVVGLAFWFKLVRKLQNRWTAALATFILGTVPLTLFYEKAVMLEIPALALAIAATYFWLQFLNEENYRRLYWFAACFGLALLTKQNTIYIVPFCTFTLLYTRQWKLLLNRRTATAAGLLCVITGPFYIVAFKTTWGIIADNVMDRAIDSPLTFYWRELPHQLGLPVLVVSVIGVTFHLLWGRRDLAAPMIMWILACAVTMTAFAGKESRYIIYWVPPFSYFAACALTLKWPLIWGRRIQAGIGAILILGGTAAAWRFQRPYVRGYEALARQITDTHDSGIILYDGGLHGNFIFFLRSHDPERRFVVMRKALYVLQITKEYGDSRELVQSDSELQELIRRYGIKYVIVSTGYPIVFEIQARLRGLLKTPQFRLVRSFPIESKGSGPEDGALLLYENKAVVPRSEDRLRLEMVTMSRGIEVSLDDVLGAEAAAKR